MDIVSDVFKKCKPDLKKLKAFGFVLNEDVWSYRKDLFDVMELRVSVHKDGNVDAYAWDKDLDERYDNVESNQYGAYVSQVRNAYIEELERIRDACFVREQFSCPQTKRILEHLRKQYGTKPQYIWKRYPDHAVLTDKSGGKWFGILMAVNGKKLGLEDREYEVLDLRSDVSMIRGLKDEKGFHEAYHMDKEKWIAVLLDDSVDDLVIQSLIEYSFDQAKESDVWIVPANPKYYDVVEEFRHHDNLIWKQSSAIHVGDIVYLYVADPYSAILYKCMAVDVDIPYEYKDKNLSMNKVMRISLLKSFPKDKYPYAYLRSIGLKMLHGPRKLNKEIADLLD
ncbi:MAG: MmcQ/YjbR family DNA-binding protein [Erysipelotrichaceae bacterium]|nr:MmcQ/YjbR family DNA-binding protein [Erysipelotrichaceae bacterium]